MPLPVPQLDDLDFETLMEQARGFIPRYAPAWTDHNIHDPGITLLELAAWLVDQQVYRAGFVSDKHIRAFAALLGVTPEPAQPTHGLIWPAQGKTTNTPALPGVSLAAGAKVSCREQPEIPFELAEAVYLSPARFSTRPLTNDGGGVFIATLASNARALAPSLTTDDSKPEEIELWFDQPLIIGDSTAAFPPIAIGVELDMKGADPRVQTSPGGYLVADYRLEAEPLRWRRIAIAADTTAALNRSGIILLEIPPASISPDAAPPIARLRIRSEQRVNPLPPRIKRVELNVLPVRQAETIRQSVIGTSNGLPNQGFSLQSGALLNPREFYLQVVENDGFVVWRQSEDLLTTAPNERLFELSGERNEIRFGNGVNGKIPPANAQIQHPDYRLTRGEAGNLQSGLNWSVAGAPLPPGQSRYGINHTPFSGGSDAWDMERLIAAVRDAALNRTSLLTNTELEEAARDLPGMAVERTSVLTGFHPAMPDRYLHNTRALIVIPKRAPGSDGVKPLPAQYFRSMNRQLQPHRVLGERLSILPARRVHLTIQAGLLYEDGLDGTAIMQEAKQRLSARFSDVQVANDWGIKPWPVGRDVRIQEIRALLAAIKGVVTVTSCQVAKASSALQTADIRLQRDEIAIAGEADCSINPVSTAQARS